MRIFRTIVASLVTFAFVCSNALSSYAQLKLSKDQLPTRELSNSIDKTTYMPPFFNAQRDRGEFSSNMDLSQDASWKRFQKADFINTFPATEAPSFPLAKDFDSLRAIQKEYFPQDHPFQVKPNDSGAMIARRMDALVDSLANVTAMTDENADVVSDDFLNKLLNVADDFTDQAGELYGDADTMNTEVDRMSDQLQQNYADLQNYDVITQPIADAFNAQSDAMADRVLEMINAVEAMIQNVDSNILNIDDILAGLDAMTGNAEEAKAFAKQLGGQYTQARDNFLALAAAFQGKGVDGEKEEAKVVDYISHLRDYAKDLEKSSSGSKVGSVKDYFRNTRRYLEETKQYLSDLIKNLKENEAYFRSAKIEPNAPEKPADVCSAKGMSASYQTCSKDCKTVCKYETTINGTNCFKCQQGGADTCWDVKLWPMSHPWCNGGICDTDPELYCVKSKAIGPNKTKLTCLSCKKRPDLCDQHFKNTSNLTNCKLGCWNGTCKYKGRYTAKEWTGRDEYLHCYECITPPLPPSCEDLKWGYDYEDDCKDNCKAPEHALK